jgi:ribosomal-protein-serine acetyltransferase
MTRIQLDEATLLRPVDEADTRQLHALVAANRAHLARWMPWAQGQTRDGTQAFVRTALAQLEAGDGLQAALVVDGRIAGAFGFHGVDWDHRRTSIGYWLAEPYQGRGLATRATRALLAHAFETWDLHRVEIRAAAANERSRAVCRRLGLVEEGVLREAERIGDRYHDLVVHSILAPEWRAAPR